jgi:hypothetical protein
MVEFVLLGGFCFHVSFSRKRLESNGWDVVAETSEHVDRNLKAVGMRLVVAALVREVSHKPGLSDVNNFHLTSA